MSKISEINVYSQTQAKRILVGKLTREGKKYFFEYDTNYKKLKNALPLGPELPLWKGRVSSNKLFPAFLDRLPSKHNPAYKDYCREWGMSENEDDVFVLLTTIGRRGPSTFILEPALEYEFSAADLKSFRARLGLTQAEFESFFDVSHMTLVRLEKGTLNSGFYKNFFSLFEQVPHALAWLLKKRGQLLHDKSRAVILKIVQDMMK